MWNNEDDPLSHSIIPSTATDPTSNERPNSSTQAVTGADFDPPSSTNLKASTVAPDRSLPTLPPTSSTSSSSSIRVTLSDPEKHGDGMKSAHVSYRMSTHIEGTATGFVASDFGCSRRYGDFVAFHSNLQTEFPAVILPPLPSKKRLDYLDRFSEEFIERRRQRLEKYVRMIVAHPSIVKSSLLKRFLQDDEYESHAVQQDEKEGVLDNVTESLLNAFTKVKEPDERFTAISAENALFEENCVALEKQYQKHVKTVEELSGVVGDLGFDFSALAGFEEALSKPLEISRLTCEKLSAYLKQSTVIDESEFLAGVHMMIGYAESIKETLKLREQKQIENESLKDYLQQTSADKEKLLSASKSGSSSSLTTFLKDKYDEMKGADPERIRQQRLTKTENRVTELQVAVDSSHDVSKMFTENVIQELKYYENVRCTEMKTLLSALVSNQLQCQRQMAAALDTLVHQLEK